MTKSGRYGGISHPFGHSNKTLKRQLQKVVREEVNIDTTGKLERVLEEVRKEQAKKDEAEQ